MSDLAPAAEAAKVQRRIGFGDPLYARVMDFLHEEARLLNRDLLDDWVAMLADDIRYTMPVRRTMLRRDGRGFDPKMTHFADSLASIKLRVRRILHTDSAYAEDPPSRVRRFVADVTVAATDRPDEYAVSSSVLVLRNRWDDPQFDLISAEREDILRDVGGNLRLAARCVLLDQTLLGTPNLAIYI